MKRLVSTLLFILIFVALHYAAVVVLEIPIWYVAVVDAVVLAVYMYMTRGKRAALLANIYFMNGNVEKARALYLKAFELKSDNAVAHLNYAVLLIREDRASEAFQYIENAQAYNKDLLISKSVDITKADCYWASGDIDTAIEVYEAMRGKYQYVHYSALAKLGFLYILKGELDKAKEVSAMAAEDNPDAAIALDNLGQIAYLQKDYETAKTWFGKALAIRGDMAESLYYMGCICEDEGDAGLAKDYFTKAKAAPITKYSGVTAEMADEKTEKYKKADD
jgi:tetratricopeptide (TPR) repeat protein